MVWYEVSILWWVERIRTPRKSGWWSIYFMIKDFEPERPKGRNKRKKPTIDKKLSNNAINDHQIQSW